MKKVLVVTILKAAFKRYEQLISKYQYFGMCTVITDAIEKRLDMPYHIPYSSIAKKYIPEFNKTFLGVDNNYYGRFWWNLDDSKSRVKAFKKLIRYYSLAENKRKFILEDDIKKVLVVDILKKAFEKYRQVVSMDEYYGMCTMIIDIIERELNPPFNVPYSRIMKTYIPEFNKEFLGVKNNYHSHFWWNLRDVNSRNEAFEKLINHYSLPENREKFILRYDT